MTPEAQRIAIAQVCGWKHEDGFPNETNWRKGRVFARFQHQLPNYLNDLNAMHEAEKEMDAEQRDGYATWLDAILDSRNDFDIVHSTAAQRAEALLLTLNLWDLSPSPADLRHHRRL